MVFFMMSKNKLLKQAIKFDKEGNFAQRDKIVHQCVPEWARYVIELTGSTVEVSGLENIPKDEAVVFVGNHQSYLDIPLLLGYSGKHTAFVAKKELGKIPLLNKWMQMLPCTFIDRKSIKKSMEAIHQASENVKKGYSQMIFPEGTRSKGGPSHPFKAGSFKLAFSSEATIVPCTIDGTYHLLEEHNRMNSAHIKLTIHPAIPTRGLTREERSKIPEQVEAQIKALLPEFKK